LQAFFKKLIKITLLKVLAYTKLEKYLFV